MFICVEAVVTDRSLLFLKVHCKILYSGSFRFTSHMLPIYIRGLTVPESKVIKDTYELCIFFTLIITYYLHASYFNIDA